MGIVSGGEKSSVAIDMDKDLLNDQLTMSTWKAYSIGFEAFFDVKHLLIDGPCS